MKIVFMGTPDFAATILKSLVEAGHEITGVYTQPDKPKGRSGALIASPVKEYALSQGFDVYQPQKIKEEEQVNILRNIDADIFVVAAFGQFLSKEILDMPKFGCVNVHGSLLPKYRGAAPIQRSIMNEEKETGVTIMRMDVGMDSGDIISQAITPISLEDDEISLYEKLAESGAKLLIDTLPLIENGTAKYIKQNEDEVTFAKMLRKEEGCLDFNMTASHLDAIIRGICVWPQGYAFLNGKMLKVCKAKAVSLEDEAALALKPGSLFVTKKNLYVACKEGFLELLEVVPEGKKKMPAMDFARGSRLVTGDRFD